MPEQFPHIPSERYELRESLGQGGMARVFKALDRNLDRQVAVKVLDERILSDPASLDRFRREARSAAGLAHPNIVRIYDFLDHPESPTLVMELIEGEDLGDYVGRVGPLDLSEALRLGEQILEALAHAHDHGLVHRDLSPRNILLEAHGGRVKVADFGIARALGDKTLTDTGQMVGSVATMSPEQAQGEDVDARSDIYSVGCLLYLMTTGRLPFQGDNPVQVALKHVGEVPTSPGRLNPELPDAIVSLILTAMSKDPDNRYADARAMLAALQAARRAPAPPELEPTRVRPAVGRTAPPPPPPASLPPLEQRRASFPWAVVAFLALLGVALAAGAYYFMGQQVQVPSLVGLDLEAARERLASVKLRLRVERQVATSEFEPNVVVSQSPVEGTTLRIGSEVRVEISQGPPTVELPDFRNLTVSRARDELGNLRLKVKVTEKPSESVPVGVVVDQDPAAGSKVTLDTTVELIVSSGAAGVIVPQLVGMKLDEARRVTDRLELELVVSEYRLDAGAEEDVVLEQNPSAGAKALKGRRILVVVSRGRTGLNVPQLEGKTVAEARTILKDMGLELKVEGEASASDPIVFQEPPPGDPVVDLVVTVRTSPSTVVPVVQGLTLEEARARIQEAGLGVGRVTTEYYEIDGEVLGQDPLPGIEVPPGSLVDLMVGDPEAAQPALPIPSATPVPPEGQFTPAPWIE